MKNSKRIDEVLSYQLRKFETLMKRRAGQYCFLDWTKRKIVTSGEQHRKSEKKIVGEERAKGVIAFIKEINARLQKEDPGGGKILLTYARLGKEAKRLRKIKKLKEAAERERENKLGK